MNYLEDTKTILYVDWRKYGDLSAVGQLVKKMFDSLSGVTVYSLYCTQDGYQLYRDEQGEAVPIGVLHGTVDDAIEELKLLNPDNIYIRPSTNDRVLKLSEVIVTEFSGVLVHYMDKPRYGNLSKSRAEYVRGVYKTLLSGAAKVYVMDEAVLGFVQTEYGQTAGVLGNFLGHIHFGLKDYQSNKKLKIGYFGSVDPFMNSAALVSFCEIVGGLDWIDLDVNTNSEVAPDVAAVFEKFSNIRLINSSASPEKYEAALRAYDLNLICYNDSPQAIDELKHSYSNKLIDCLEAGGRIICYGPSDIPTIKECERRQIGLVFNTLPTLRSAFDNKTEFLMSLGQFSKPEYFSRLHDVSEQKRNNLKAFVTLVNPQPLSSVKPQPPSLPSSSMSDSWRFGKVSYDILEQMDIERALTPLLHGLQSWDKRKKERTVKRWLNMFNYRTHQLPETSSAKFLFNISMNRDDYSSFFRAVSDAAGPGKSIYAEEFKTNNQEVNLRAVEFMRQSLPLFTLVDAPTSVDKILLRIKFCEYVFYLSHLLEYDFEYLVSFADMQPSENLISQYCNLIGKPKITLQHGLYVDYEGYDTVNVVNYENHASKTFLAWGDCTGSLIKKYHPKSNVIVCGKPFLTVTEKSADVGGKDYLSVVMDQEMFLEQNLEMLRIAADVALQKGLRLNVKFHPQNDREKYQALGFAMEQSLDLVNSEFVIGHTSSLGYELLRMGVPTFFYNSEKPRLPTPWSVMFSSAEGLIERLAVETDFVEISKPFLAYTGSESLGKYREFFEGL